MRTLSRAESVAWSLDALPACRRAGLVVLLLDRTPREADLNDALQRAAARHEALGASIEPMPCGLLPPTLGAAGPLVFERLDTAANAGTGYQGLLDVLEERLRAPFRSGERLCRALLVPDLDGEAALVLHLHPLAAGRLGWLEDLLDSGPEEVAPRRAADAPAETGSWLGRWASGVRDEAATFAARSADRLRQLPDLLRDPGRALADTQTGMETVLRLMTDTPRMAPAGGDGPSHLGSFSLRWEDLAETARVADCEPLDVVRAGVALTLLARGQTQVRARLDDAEIPWLPSHFDMPLDGAAGRSLLAKVKRARQRAMADAPTAGVAEWSDLADRLPTSLVSGLLGTNLSPGDLVCEYAPGLPVAAWLAGARVEAIRTFTTRRATRVAASLVRSHEDAAIGLTLDAELFPEPEPLLHEMRERFRALLAIAG